MKSPTRKSIKPKPNLADATIDKGVKKPRGIRQADPNSILSQLIALQPGETFSRAERHPDTTPWSTIMDRKAAMRASMSTQAARATQAVRQDGGGFFTLSIGDFRAADGYMFVVTTITRSD